jgi:hypothetical protein
MRQQRNETQVEREAKRAASDDNAQAQIAAHKARMREAETVGLMLHAGAGSTRG